MTPGEIVVWAAILLGPVALMWLLVYIVVYLPMKRVGLY